MTKLLCLFIVSCFILINGCAVAPQALPVAGTTDVVDFKRVIEQSYTETILLVSLADGSVVKQSIPGAADICFKQNGSTETTCLTQGDAIFDGKTQRVIGHKMIEDHIQLVPSN